MFGNEEFVMSALQLREAVEFNENVVAHFKAGLMTVGDKSATLWQTAEESIEQRTHTGSGPKLVRNGKACSKTHSYVLEHAQEYMQVDQGHQINNRGFVTQAVPTTASRVSLNGRLGAMSSCKTHSHVLCRVQACVRVVRGLSINYQGLSKPLDRPQCPQRSPAGHRPSAAVTLYSL